MRQNNEDGDSISSFSLESDVESGMFSYESCSFWILLNGEMNILFYLT